MGGCKLATMLVAAVVLLMVGCGGGDDGGGEACGETTCGASEICCTACDGSPFCVAGDACPGGACLDAGGSCEETPCFRPYECVAMCGGPLLYSGCCPCEPGQLDRVVDCGDAGADAGDAAVAAERCSFDIGPCDFTSGAGCPTSEPTEGASCDLDSAASCYYCEGDPPASGPVDGWRCDGGSWSVAAEACGAGG